MIRHLLILSWNKKRQHLFLIFELFFFFLAISFVFLFVINVSRETKSSNRPLVVDNLIAMDYGFYNDSTFQTFKSNLQQIQEVREVSLISDLPYRGYAHGIEIQYANQRLNTSFILTDENLQSTLGLVMQSGKWFEQAGSNAGNEVVISTSLKEKLFPAKLALHELITIKDEVYKITGVVDRIEELGSTSEEYQIFMRNPKAAFSVLVKLKVPITEKIYNKLLQTALAFSPFRPDIIPIAQTRDQKQKEQFIPKLIMGSLTLFLTLSIVLGLFSILYQNINRRKSEIGIRRAAGATSRNIYGQIVMEMLFLATLALIPSVLVAYQFAIFDVFKCAQSDYVFAIIGGCLVIYSLVTLCALYPAWMAAKIHPAEALHDD